LNLAFLPESSILTKKCDLQGRVLIFEIKIMVISRISELLHSAWWSNASGPLLIFT